MSFLHSAHVVSTWKPFSKLTTHFLACSASDFQIMLVNFCGDLADKQDVMYCVGPWSRKYNTRSVYDFNKMVIYDIGEYDQN